MVGKTLMGMYIQKMISFKSSSGDNYFLYQKHQHCIKICVVICQCTNVRATLNVTLILALGSVWQLPNVSLQNTFYICNASVDTQKQPIDIFLCECVRRNIVLITFGINCWTSDQSFETQFHSNSNWNIYFFRNWNGCKCILYLRYNGNVRESILMNLNIKISDLIPAGIP